MTRHEKNIHRGSIDGEGIGHACGLCPLIIADREEMILHRKKHLKEVRKEEEDKGSIAGFFSLESAHGKTCEVLRNYLPSDKTALDQALNFLHPRLAKLLRSRQCMYKLFKVGFVLNVEFVKIEKDAIISESITCPFRSSQTTISKFDPIEYMVVEALSEIESNVEEFLKRGSGWSINDILFFDVEVAQCKLLAGSCGLHSAEYKYRAGLSFKADGFATSATAATTATAANIPVNGGEKKGEKVNGENLNEECFYLAIARPFVGPRGQEDPRLLYDFIASSLCKNVRTPVSLEDIQVFEEAHSHLNLSINVVYKDEDQEVYPVRVSKNINATNTIVLLLGFLSGDPSNRMHYAYLPEPEKALALRRKDDAEGGANTRQTYQTRLCFNCFNYVHRDSAYEEHVGWCHQKTGQRVQMPSKGETLSFENEEKKHKIGYTIFFDIETLQCKPKGGSCSCTEEMRIEAEKSLVMSERELEDEAILYSLEANYRRPPPIKMCKHKTHILSEHQPFALAYIMVDRTGQIVEQDRFVGENCASLFLEELFRIEKKYEPIFKKGVPMKASPRVEEERRNAVYCHICTGILGDDRVADHDHISGDFIGMAHDLCNLHRREPQKIVVFAHNFSGYDSHIIVREMGKVRIN